MPPEFLHTEAPSQMGRPKKPATAQVRIAADLVDQAWRIGALKGYRQAGDFLTDLLRPLLSQMERELMAERSRQIGPSTAPTPPKKGGGK